MVALLIEHGAAIDRRNAVGATPLNSAIKAGHSDTAAWLILHGAAIEGPDEVGRTMLFWVEFVRGGSITSTC